MVPIAINFPSSLDTLTNPITGGTILASQVSDAFDGVEALEARVGITGSAVTSSLTYRIATVETFAVTQGAWTAWTPVITQSATPTFTNASVYMKVGRMVTAFVYCSFTSAGTAANDISISLPVASTGGVGGGDFCYRVSASTFFAGSISEVAANSVKLWVGGSAAGRFGQSTTIASGDSLSAMICYQSAA